MKASKRPSLWSLCLGVCASTAIAASAQPPAESAAIENSVVKVFATMRYPDPFRPWTKQAPSEATACGVVIEGKRFLTNAHVVPYASQVQIQANAAGVLRDLKDPFVSIEFDQKGGEGLLFSRPAMVAATEDILTDNGVRAQGSPDTIAVWQGKAAN